MSGIDPMKGNGCNVCWSRWSQRCGQPGQQQGRRFPSLRLEQPHTIRRVLVSAFLADSIQQIHSLRARGVMSSQVSNAFASEISALFRSAGRSWTTPPEISFLLRVSLVSWSCENPDWRCAVAGRIAWFVCKSVCKLLHFCRPDDLSLPQITFWNIPPVRKVKAGVFYRPSLRVHTLTDVTRPLLRRHSCFRRLGFAIL